MRLLTAAAACVSVGLALPLAVPADANAVTTGCVTSREYYRAARGMTPSEVRHLFGTSGTVIYDHTVMQQIDKGNGAVLDTWHRFVVRSYRKCPRFENGRGRVGVRFDDPATTILRLTAKTHRSPRDLIPY